MKLKEQQLAATAKALVNTLQIVKMYAPEDIQKLIIEQILITEDILKIAENETTSSN
jgi:hypothetical protein